MILSEKKNRRNFNTIRFYEFESRRLFYVNRDTMPVIFTRCYKRKLKQEGGGKGGGDFSGES